MKRKELMKRALALSLSAVMAAGNIPVVTYANEVVQMEDEWELQTKEEELSENEISAQEDIQGSEVQQAESDGEEIIQVEDSTLPEESIVIDNSVEETASPEIPVMDNQGTNSSEQTEEQQAAQAYLNENYIEKNKIISNGGDSVAKSTDGLTYRIGLKNPSGSSLTTLRLKYEGKTSQYKAGWYINSEWVNVGTKKPADPGSVGINRPTAEQGEQTFTAKLRLFSADTNTETINDETQAATAALATQEFTIILEAAEPAYVMTVNVKDEAGNPVSDAEIILEKNFTKVTPRQDGSYDMEKGAQYTLTVKKDGYNDYKESNFTFNPTEVTTVKEVTLKKTVTKTINFTVTDQTTSKVIDNAKVTVKKGYSTEKPEEDGSYRLVEGTTYNYTVEAKNYKSVNSSFTVGDQQTIAVQLEKNISEYTVHINPTDKDGEQITNASIKVTYEEEDPYDEYETITEELKVNADGTYTMKKGVTYTYTITAPDYVTVKDTYTPSGDKETVSVPVKMVSSINPEDEKTVNAIKAKFDAEMGALRPNYATDKNVLDVVKNKIKAYGIDTTDVTITVKSSSDVERISTNGDIHYKKEQPDPYGNNSVNIGLVFAFEKNGAKAESKERTVTVCWDRDYFNEQMNKEKTDLTWNKIKGSNSSETEVTANLTLPQCMSNSTRTAWSKITWTSSDENVISLKDTGYGSLIDAKEGVIHAQPEDTEVTLTATFHANASLLNSYVEKESDFATLTKEFKVMVKGNGVALPTEQELKAILDQYYTADQIMESGTDTVADLTNCKTDLKLPRYTRIKDKEGNFVFNNKEIAVTSDVEALGISGFKVNVDRFASEKDIKANLIVTFTREGVTAKKTIPVTIKPITEAEVKSELDMMEAAKEHYFDGINDGRYKDKDSITGNLHAFQEMIFDENGNSKWIYRSADQTGKGIIPDDMFTDSFEMEGAGYNKFKSSNHTVVAHESLLVTRRENDTQVTISSLLSSAAYKTSAEKHPDNTLLQKLYKQPVSVTVTVKGTKSAKENLETKLAEGKAFCDSIVEGNAAGQYPLGTKAKLQEAIAEAEKVLENATSTEEELEKAFHTLTERLNEAQNVQNEAEATVTAKINREAGKDMDVSTMTVKAGTAEKYGYTKPETCKNKVTILDVLVAWHAAYYGEDFTSNPTKYLIAAGNGAISKIYGIQTYDIGLFVNNKMPGNYSANEAVVENGDIVTVYLYGDTQKYKDLYLYFEGIPGTVQAGERINLTLYGIHPIYSMGENAEQASVQKGYMVAALDAAGRQAATAVTNENGQATLQINQAGTYQITVVETPKDSQETAYILPKDMVTVIGEENRPSEHVHHYGEWRTVSKATVFAAEQQERVCECGEKETRTAGTALKATIKVNMTTIPLKTKQSTAKFKVSGLANGDEVVSYTSGNKKIFTVDKNGKIKAGKKKGSAKLTITLKSGLKKTITVKVQKTTVKTKKIQNLQKKITLKKGAKLTLKPVVYPLTSGQKIKYASSKKKVATVSSKGVIKAKKAGKTTITVKSGNKKFKITVKVK